MIIKTTNLTKTFRTSDIETIAVNNICLEIEKGEFVAIMGPSGCGKTTLLNILGLLDSPTSGSFMLNGTDVGTLGERDRTRLRRGKIGFVFQSFNLIDELTVWENIELPLTYMKIPSAERRKLVNDIMQRMEISHRAKHFPHQLSGGQQQRVAIARALINHPRMLLLDEPLGALDLQLRKEMQIELKRMQQQLGITFIYVTHDQEEALTMSDRIVVMNGGIIDQIGTPQDIYNEPTNAFVAKFIGESNIVGGIMHDDFDVEFASKRFVCVDKGFDKKEPVDVVIRPEDIRVGEPGENTIDGTVETVTFKGVHYEIIVDSFGVKWKIHSTKSVEPGSFIGMSLTPEDIHIMHKSYASKDANDAVIEEGANNEIPY